MASMASTFADFTLVADLGGIGVDLSRAYEFIERFVRFGGTRNQITKHDIHVKMLTGAGGDVPESWEVAKAAGTRLFDYLVFITMDPDERPDVEKIATATDVVTDAQVASALLVTFIIYVTQARPPATGVNSPRILTNVFGMTEPLETYASRVASFNLLKLDPQWIQHIKFTNMQPEIANRLGLGMAGYRNLQAFTYMPITKTISAEERAAVDAIKTFVGSGLKWEMHPLFRPSRFMTAFGSLNAILGNLMLKVYTAAELETMVDQKMIYATPTMNPRAKGIDVLNVANFGFATTDVNFTT